MNIKYYDESNDEILYNSSMIHEELSISRSKAKRTIKQLGIKPYFVYKNIHLYTETDFYEIEEYLNRQKTDKYFE
jgi:hypothetical protein